jgi:hypothetical protein
MTSVEHSDGQVLQRILLTVTAVGMALSSVLVTFDAAGPGEAITPPGPFFAIWGLVIALWLAVAASCWWRYNPVLAGRIGWAVIVAQLGFTGWLFVASAGSGIGTVAVFAVILASLLVAMARLRCVPPGPGVRLAGAAIGLYAGWSSAAIWLNVVTTLPTRLADSTPVQCAGLVGTGLTAAAVLRLLRPPAAYPAALAWGLVGVGVSAFSHRAWPQLTVAILAFLAVAILAAAGRTADLHLGQPVGEPDVRPVTE